MNTGTQAPNTPALTCTQADADTCTLQFWKAYKAWGGSSIVYVGLSGTGTSPGRITRVTTRNVFVKLEGACAEPFHPRDLRAANPNAIAAMRRAGIIHPDELRTA